MQKYYTIFPKLPSPKPKLMITKNIFAISYQLKVNLKYDILKEESNFTLLVPQKRCQSIKIQIEF